MQLTFNVNLHRLHCITPDDEGGDEPYLWAFLFKIDGETVRQRADDPRFLVASVTIVSGSGSHGNLGVEDILSGATLMIPPPIGDMQGSLRPIRLDLPLGGTRVRAYVPGVIVGVAVLMDEDSTPSDAIDVAHADVRALAQSRANELIGQFDLQALAAQAQGLLDSGAAADLSRAVRQVMTQRLDGMAATLRAELRAAAIQSATITVMSSWNPFDHLAAALDGDDLIGSATFQIFEDALVAAGVSDVLRRDLRQEQQGLGGAWYILHGTVGGQIRFGPADVQAFARTLRTVVSQTEEHTFRERQLCIEPGTKVTWERVNHAQEYEVHVAYPFARFEYALDGVVLNGPTGQVLLNKNAVYQDFTEKLGKGFRQNRTQTQNVVVTFQRLVRPEEPQIERMLIRNLPDDGNYDAYLEITAVLGNGTRLSVGGTLLTFEGETIRISDSFLATLRKCLEKFESPNDRFAISKRLFLTDLWGPYGRQRRYDDVVREARDLLELGAIDQALHGALLGQVARRLKIARR